MAPAERKAKTHLIRLVSETLDFVKAKVAREAGIAARRAVKDKALRKFGKEALDAAGVGFCDLPECGQMIPLGNIFGLACRNAHKTTQKKSRRARGLVGGHERWATRGGRRSGGDDRGATRG